MNRPLIHRTVRLLLGFCLTCSGGFLAADDDGAELITLNFPDSVELKVFVDYVSQRIGMNILYDDDLVATHVTIRSPTRITRDSLPGLLETILKMRGLVLVDAEPAGWKRILRADDMAGVARPSDRPREDLPQLKPAEVLTQVIQLRHMGAKQCQSIIEPLLTNPGGKIAMIEEQQLLIITDYAETLARVTGLAAMLDRPRQVSVVQFSKVGHPDAVPLVQEIMNMRLASRPSAGAGEQVALVHDPRTGQAAVIGAPELVEQAVEMLQTLDVPTEAVSSPVRFYKLTNTAAADVLAVLLSLEKDQTLAGAAVAPRRPTHLPGLAEPVPGANRPPAEPGEVEPAPPAVQRREPEAEEPQPAAPPADARSQRLHEVVAARPAVVTADPNTNSIIVIADPAMQAVYAELIAQLDKRRPQVLIECYIVSIDTSRGYSIGVEIGGSGSRGDTQFVTFSSFGLSEPDPATGQLALVPGFGLNAAIMRPDVADVIIRALSTSSRAKVVSAPRILVNDNAAGTLTSEAQAPFASLNAFDTVATTSFAGYVGAGTTVNVRPHISEGDHLLLAYDIKLSRFAGAGTLEIPPPRLEDRVESVVTIPDGSMIVIGGLRFQTMNESVSALPVIGRIPLLGLLFSNRLHDRQETTLFVFIRPVILRDDAFADLKMFSDPQIRAAGVRGDFPDSHPLLMH